MKKKLSKLTLGVLSVGALSITPALLFTNNDSNVQFNENNVQNNKQSMVDFGFLEATASNITHSSATITSIYVNGTGGQQVGRAVAKLEPQDGSNDLVIAQPVNPDYLTNRVIFEATGLKPTTNYKVDIQFFGPNGDNSLGVFSGTPFITADREFSHTDLVPSNITQETATVTSTFLNATGAFPIVDNAILTYKEVPGGSEFTAAPTTADYDAGIITWDLSGLKPSTEYEISVEYFSGGTSVANETGMNFETLDSLFMHNDVSYSNIDQTSFTVTTTFTNGSTIPQVADAAELTITPVGGSAFPVIFPENPDYSSGTLTFNVTGLTPSTAYEVSIEYFNSGNSLGVYDAPVIGTLDVDLVQNELVATNITPTTSTVTSRFTNGTGEEEMDGAELIVTPVNGGTTIVIDPTTEDYVNGVITWDVIGLEPSTEYELLVTYRKGMVVKVSHPGDNFTTSDIDFAHNNLVGSDVTQTTAKVTSTFTNGTGAQIADEAELTVKPVGGTALSPILPTSPDYGSGTLTFDLTNLDPSTEYEISVEYFNAGNSLGVHTGDNFTTTDVDFAHTILEANNITQTEATVTSTFTQGTGAQMVDEAQLTVTPVGGTALSPILPTSPDYGSGTLTFDLTNLDPSTEYEISVEYFNAGTSLGIFPGINFTTSDDAFDHTNLVASNITQTTATVTSTFTNGTGAQKMDGAELTVTPVGGTAITVLPATEDYVNGVVTWDLSGLNPSTEYEIFVKYLQGATVIEQFPGDNFTTDDDAFGHTNLVASNETQTTATVTSTFTQGTGAQMVDGAELTVIDVNSGTPLPSPILPTSPDYASGTLTFDVTGLNPSTEYSISVEYFNAGTPLGEYTGNNFTTTDDAFGHANLVASNETQTTATVTSTFTQGTGAQMVDGAELTVIDVNSGTPLPSTILPTNPDYASGTLTFDVTGLNPSTEYEISVEYFNAGNPLGEYTGNNFTTTDDAFGHTNLVASNITETSATVTARFTHGTGAQIVDDAKLTVTPVNGGADIIVEPATEDYVNGVITFDLTGLNPSTEYEISIEYFNAGNSLGIINNGDSFTTADDAFGHTSLVASNITETSATVTSTFTQGTGAQMVDGAKLTVTPVNGGTPILIDPTTEDYVNGVIVFDLTNLDPSTEYEISVEYFNAGNSLGIINNGDRFTTADNAFAHTGLVTSNITQTTATVTSTFTHGTGAQIVDDAKLTVTPVNGGADIIVEPATEDYVNGVITFDLTGLNPSTEYEISVEYFNSGNSLGFSTGDSFTTSDAMMSTGSVNAEWVNGFMKVNVNGFTNGTSSQEAVNFKVILTNTEDSTKKEYDGGPITGNEISWEIDGLDQSIEYKVEVVYYNSSDIEIDRTDSYTLQAISGMSTGLIAGLSAGLGVLLLLLLRLRRNN